MSVKQYEYSARWIHFSALEDLSGEVCLYCSEEITHEILLNETSEFIVTWVFMYGIDNFPGFGNLKYNLDGIKFKKDNIKTYAITTEMGTGNYPFLTKEQEKEMNSIGYSGKTLDGTKMSMECYLNSLNEGQFSVVQTKFDNGDFTEKFIITKIEKI